jgi:hypothetical protein
VVNFCALRGEIDWLEPRIWSLNISLIPNLTDLVFLEDEFEFFQRTVLLGVLTPNRTLMKVLASTNLISMLSSTH